MDLFLPHAPAGLRHRLLPSGTDWQLVLSRLRSWLSPFGDSLRPCLRPILLFDATHGGTTCGTIHRHAVPGAGIWNQFLCRLWHRFIRIEPFRIRGRPLRPVGGFPYHVPGCGFYRPGPARSFLEKPSIQGLIAPLIATYPLLEPPYVTDTHGNEIHGNRCQQQSHDTRYQERPGHPQYLADSIGESENHIRERKDR